MWRSPFILLFAACGAPDVLPAVDVATDERLTALPADTTVVASVDLGALARGTGAEALLRQAGVDPAPLQALARAGVGLPGFRVGDARIGCGSAGCVALLQGTFDAAGVDALELALAPRGDVLPGTGELPGFDLDPADGPGQVLRVLSPEKAVFGDREAVRAVWEQVKSGTAGFDPGWFVGRIPPGEVWVAARDAATVEAQAAARIGGDEAAASPIHAAFARLRAQAPALDRIDTVAVALDADGVLRARAWCPEEADAADLEARLGAAVLVEPALRGATVRRERGHIELVAHPTGAALAALFGEAR